MITQTLNRAEAEALFQKEAVLFEHDAVPEYRVMELFGDVAAEFISRTLKCDGYLKGGTDWNAWGSCEPGRPMIYYYRLPGFLKIVAEHNYVHALELHRGSKGGALSDKMWEERETSLEKADKRRK